MRATLSSTILAGGVRSSPDSRGSPAELLRLRPERKRPTGALCRDQAGAGLGAPARRGELPGADWQRAGDVRAPRRPKGRGRPWGSEARLCVLRWKRAFTVGLSRPEAQETILCPRSIEQ
ncbi:ubiquitin-conjugating enzyme E2 D3 isoform X2 [Ovis canadensis]|uniref:ubiquitin-conjugating enzyme E2 D3 isoform X2 n=1 Tax=Ovis canadensis TaxID=37174 RepID=UPI00375084D9